MENFNVDMETSVIKIYLPLPLGIMCKRCLPCTTLLHYMGNSLVPPYILFAWTMDDIPSLPFLHLTRNYIILVFWMLICLKTELIRHATIVVAFIFALVARIVLKVVSKSKTCYLCYLFCN